MINQVTFSLMLMWFPQTLIGINDLLSHALNSLAGRSWLFDNLISLPLVNDLVKAALIGSCFLAAWHSKESPDEAQKIRRILITTLIAATFVIATTKIISHTVFLPRPFIQSQKVYHLEGEALVENKRLEYRVPLDKSSRESYRDLLNGDIQTNDLGSFPSDHAGFFITIAVGIWLASRLIGSIAVGWTCLGILASKMITGQHTPLDIASGAAIGIAWLAFWQYLAKNWLGSLFNQVSSWTLKYQALSSALIFAVMFEVSNTLTHVPPLLKLAVTIGKYTLRGGQ